MKKTIASIITIILSVFTISSCGGGFQLRPDVAMEVVDRKNQLKYFTEYTETDEVIDVAPGSINVGYSYTAESFVYDGDTYVRITPMAVYMDGHRKGAVANLYDGENEMTVYEYDYPGEFNILNVSEFLYCKEDELEEMYSFYSDPDECEFTYQFIYMVPDRRDRIVIEIFEDIEYDDTLFLELANASPDVCEQVKTVTRRSKPVSIRQYTETSYFVRTVEFYRTEGELYMIIFNHMSEDGSDMDVHNCYHITDPDVINYVNDKMDECNEIIMDEYGHAQPEY